MKHALAYLLYGAEYRIREGIPPIRKRWERGAYPYCGRKSLPDQEAGALFRSRLEENTPFCAGRFGFFELSAMRNFYFAKAGNYQKILESLKNCAGVFPPMEQTGEEFLELMKNSLGEMDFLLCSGEPFENYFAGQFGKKSLVWVPNLRLACPWFFEQPWSEALEGQKVLIVNPFAKTIRSQYQHREKLFSGTRILPEFTLLTYRSMFTIGEFQDPAFPDFFTVLEHQFEEISRLDFEVALLGCGAYGFPLAAMITSRLKRTAIHMGGVLQLLFGILGARWDGSRFPGQGPNPGIRPYINEYWTYPSREETPEAAAGVEYGHYWKSGKSEERKENG